MKTNWDYTELAEAYLKRPQYSDQAIDQLMELSGVTRGDQVCDVGAGVAHLTLKLADRGYVLDVGKIALSGTSEELLASEKVQEAYLGKKH